MADNSELKTAVLGQLCNEFVPLTMSFQAAQRKRDNIRVLLNSAIGEFDGDIEMAVAKVRKELGGEETTLEPVQAQAPQASEPEITQAQEPEQVIEPEPKIQAFEPVAEPEQPAEKSDDIDFMPVDTPLVSKSPEPADEPGNIDDNIADDDIDDADNNVDTDEIDFKSAFNLDKTDDLPQAVISEKKKKPVKKSSKSAVKDEDIIMRKAMVPRSVETFLNSIFPSYTDASFGDKISAMAYILSDHDCDEISQRARAIADEYEQKQKNKRGVTIEDIGKSLVSLRGHLLEILQISYETRAAAAYVELQRSYSRSGAPPIDNIDFFSEDMQKYLKRLHTLAERERRSETDARGREIRKSTYNDDENN